MTCPITHEMHPAGNIKILAATLDSWVFYRYVSQPPIDSTTPEEERDDSYVAGSNDVVAIARCVGSPLAAGGGAPHSGATRGRPGEHAGGWQPARHAGQC